MKIWVNGTLLERDDAKVHVLDAGLQHAVGVFETMQARSGVIFRGQNHLQRLADSGRELGLLERLNTVPLLDAAHATVAANGLSAARVRLTVTGGDLNALTTGGGGPVDPTIIITATPPTQYPDTFVTEGVTATIAEGRDNPFDLMAGHKTLNYWSRIRELQVAAQKEAGEALRFTVSNHLASGSVSNAFLVRDGVLQTPIARGEEEQGALPSSVLPGITRAAVIEIAERLGIAVERRMLDIEELLGSSELFLTNSSWGILPVVRVERETIGSGLVGDVTSRLRAELVATIVEETSSGSTGVE